MIKNLLQFTMQSADSACVQKIKDFLPSVQAFYKKKIYSQLLSLFLVLSLIAIFFLILCKIGVKLSFSSVVPFFVMILVFYAILFASLIAGLVCTPRSILKAIADTDMISVLRDSFIYRSCSYEKVGNDISSESMESYIFHNTESKKNIYLSCRQHNFFYDKLVPGKVYKIYIINKKYVLIIRNDEI